MWAWHINNSTHNSLITLFRTFKLIISTGIHIEESVCCHAAAAATCLRFVVIRDEVPSTPAIGANPREGACCIRTPHRPHHLTHFLIRAEYNGAWRVCREKEREIMKILLYGTFLYLICIRQADPMQRWHARGFSLIGWICQPFDL